MGTAATLAEGHSRGRCRGSIAGWGARHATPSIRELAGLDPQLQQNKVVNLRLAAARLDGLVLRQGELGVGVGGGMCQFTNLLFWLTLHTPLTVVERWRHRYDVSPGSGSR